MSFESGSQSRIKDELQQKPDPTLFFETQAKVLDRLFSGNSTLMQEFLGGAQSEENGELLREVVTDYISEHEIVNIDEIATILRSRLDSSPQLH